MALIVEPASASGLTVDLSADNGVVRATEPGLTCADDGEGSYRHYLADSPLAGGVLSNLPGKARATLDVHYDGDKALAAKAPNAFLLGSESHVTLSNERGSVQVALPAGSCAAPAVTFDGTTVSSTDRPPWGAVSGTGAYREATGAGSFSVTAEMSPGADNAWSIKLDGSLSVLQPALTAKVERTYWGNLGLDYVTRVVTVVYRVTNTGNGDSFGARFKSAASTTPGVRACGEPQTLLDTCPTSAPPERPLGDLASCPDSSLPATCDTELVRVRYRIEPLPGGPCFAVVLGCTFVTKVVVQMPDALDVATDNDGKNAPGGDKTMDVTVRAPLLPPPLR